MAVADVVGQVTGHEPTEEEMIALAGHTTSASHSGPIYKRPAADASNSDSGGGISLNDLGVLLDHYGVHSVVTDTEQADQTGVKTGLTALEQYLGDGRKVIAYVNSGIIWESSDGQHREGDHFLVVTGIDAKTGLVHLNDSGAGAGADEQVKLERFLKAWHTSEDSMVVTTAAR